MTQIEIRTKGFPQLQDAMREMPLQAMRAARRANRKAADYARGRFAKEMAARTDIKQSLFRERRALSFFASAVDSEGRSKMWFGYNPLKAAYVGDLKADPAGAWAGKYFFQGAFIATMRSGHRGIFQREGRRIFEQSVNLPQAPAVAELVAADTNDRLGTLLDQELRYERMKT